VVFAGVRAVEAEIVFVGVPPGCFDMGSPEREAGRYPDEGPMRRVCLKAFDLGKFEVTQAQWRRVMVHNPSPSQQQGDTLPVDSISWNEAKHLAALMSFFGKYQYRLPSESEWEYAARANTKTARFWGEQPEGGCLYANGADQALQRKAPRKQDLTVECDDGYFTTAPVGSFKPNAFGLHDMLGNVAEFAEDCYVDTYRDAPKDGSAYVTPDCPKRVDRGGSWNDKPANVRAADRGDSAPGNRLARFGVRLVRTSGP
jgi:formylglycine-generating enzyme required for sulfatase activity